MSREEELWERSTQTDKRASKQEAWASTFRSDTRIGLAKRNIARELRSEANEARRDYYDFVKRHSKK